MTETETETERQTETDRDRDREKLCWIALAGVSARRLERRPYLQSYPPLLFVQFLQIKPCNGQCWAVDEVDRRS